MLKRLLRPKYTSTVLAWSGWMRVLVLLPLLTALWLAVLWASAEVTPL